MYNVIDPNESNESAVLQRRQRILPSTDKYYDCKDFIFPIGDKTQFLVVSNSFHTKGIKYEFPDVHGGIACIPKTDLERGAGVSIDDMAKTPLECVMRRLAKAYKETTEEQKNKLSHDREVLSQALIKAGGYGCFKRVGSDLEMTNQEGSVIHAPIFLMDNDEFSILRNVTALLTEGRFQKEDIYIAHNVLDALYLGIQALSLGIPYRGIYDLNMDYSVGIRTAIEILGLEQYSLSVGLLNKLRGTEVMKILSEFEALVEEWKVNYSDLTPEVILDTLIKRLSWTLENFEEWKAAKEKEANKEVDDDTQPSR